jgi:hypothetical protein
MTNINIKGTEDSASVIIDFYNGIFEISGRSMPENVKSFYEPIVESISSVVTNISQYLHPILFTLKIIYFNIASSKIILDILLILEEMHKAGKEITIHWYYKENDENMLETDSSINNR